MCVNDPLKMNVFALTSSYKPTHLFQLMIFCYLSTANCSSAENTAAILSVSNLEVEIVRYDLVQFTFNTQFDSCVRAASTIGKCWSFSCISRRFVFIFRLVSNAF